MNYRNAPVVVFLEGEGFIAGAPSRFPAQDLAAEGLVIVSVAYRLNVFGKCNLNHRMSTYCFKDALKVPQQITFKIC